MFRDFCSCYVYGEQKDGSISVGTYCESPLCPEFPQFIRYKQRYVTDLGCPLNLCSVVRAEQNIIVIQCRQLTDTSCMVTQTGAVTYKVISLTPVLYGHLSSVCVSGKLAAKSGGYEHGQTVCHIWRGLD